MKKLGEMIEKKEFYLTSPIERLPTQGKIKPMKLKRDIPFVGDIMTRHVVTAHATESITSVSEIFIKHEIDQVPIVDIDGKLVGIVTSWDLTKALATKKKKIEDIMTKKVVTSRKGEYVDAAARRLGKYQINATPVVDDEGRLIGIITSSDINKVLGTVR
jgi:CBS domain-containing protein